MHALFPHTARWFEEMSENENSNKSQFYHLVFSQKKNLWNTIYAVAVVIIKGSDTQKL